MSTKEDPTIFSSGCELWEPEKVGENNFSDSKFTVFLFVEGVTCTDGELWRIQRSFVVTHLRSLGFGKKPMELLIKEEITEVLSTLRDNSKAVEVGKILAPAIINILWALTSGTRISRKDRRLNRLLELLAMRTKVFDMSGGTLSQHPWLRFVAPEKTGYNIMKRINRDLRDLLMETIEQHYESWTEGADSDLIYSFISEMKKSNGHKNTFTGKCCSIYFSNYHIQIVQYICLRRDSLKQKIGCLKF